MSAIPAWARVGAKVVCVDDSRAKSVIAVEAATGISRHDLRPDVFGPKTEAAA